MAQNFPIFYMISFGIQYLYITSKISSEKESKAKEGMKMMGLRNTTYYAAWFITYIMISIVTSFIVSSMAITLIFQKVNFFLFFTFSMLYSINLWAWALIIVAFLPTKRSSGLAAVLFNFISYYLVFIIQDIATPSALQYGMSIVPNVCMT
jgi:ATP-binding cassette, subfamily A (ABC1), member 3